MVQLDTSYRRGLEHNYLVIKNDEYVEGYELQMLIHNRINNILGLQVKNNNGVYEYCYEISSMQPLGRMYEHRQMSHENIAKIIRGVMDAVRSTKEYMLDNDGLVIAPDYIYVDVESLAVSLIHYPLYECDVKQSFKSMAEFILDKVDHQDNRAVMLAYDFFKIIKTDSFVLSEIELLLERYQNDNTFNANSTPSKSDEYPSENQSYGGGNYYPDSASNDFNRNGYKKNEYKNENQKNDWHQNNYQLNNSNQNDLNYKASKESLLSKLLRNKKDKDVIKDVTKDVVPVVTKETVIQKEAVMQKETFIPKEPEESSYGKTVVLSRENQPVQSKRRRLVTEDGKKEYPLDNLPITIGKAKDIVDIVVKDGTVSRMHATLYEENGRIYLSDLSSSNGSYVNSVLIDPNLPMLLESEDIIMLGRAKFTYYE